LRSSRRWCYWRRTRRRKTAPSKPSEYHARRAAFVKALGPDSAFIAFSREPARRTGDVDWPFRQEDNLLYLTGLNEPDTTLVLVPGEREHAELVFARDRDPSQEACREARVTSNRTWRTNNGSLDQSEGSAVRRSAIPDPRSEISGRVLVRPEGLEPPAFRFEACRSIQLSYGRTEG
jgi:hypothetical protein